MHKVSGDLNKITQARAAVQENTGKLIESTISQALARPQDSTSIEANPPGHLDLLGQNKHQTHQMMRTLLYPCKTDDFGVTQHLNGEAYHLQIPQKIPMSPHTYVSQQQPNPTSFDFNQSIVGIIPKPNRTDT